jgi:hypothetical protein
MEKQFVLSNLPSIKLSYEKIIHKKVCSDFILAIPHGPKNLIWFTIFDNKNVCFLIELGERNINIKEQIKDVRIIKMPFHNNDTILYGTFFTSSEQNLFTIENIYYYKGKILEQSSWLNKFSLINDFLHNNLKQNKNQGFFGKPFLNFGTPLVHNNYEELMKMIENNKSLYRIHNIAFRLKDKNGSLVLPFTPYKMPTQSEFITEEKVVTDIKFNQTNILNILYGKTNVLDKTQVITKTNVITKQNINKPIVQKVKEQVLLVKPDIQNDIYHLYSFNELDKTYSNYVGVASIPDYSTSVLLNKIFRNIKENDNLDALEESDDEDEFENNKEDRFVYLEKECMFNCVFNHKFKKWMPKSTFRKS